MAKGKCKNLTKRNQEHWASSEHSTPTAVSPGYPNAKNLKTQLQVQDNILLRCDPDKLQRVFDNLLRNAVNYSFENTPIRITAKTDAARVLLTFENDGDTISEENLTRLFEQFYRLDTSRSSRSGGAGLGLAIAKEIVELHGGTITAFSENDVIRFDVALPL